MKIPLTPDLSRWQTVVLGACRVFSMRTPVGMCSLRFPSKSSNTGPNSGCTISRVYQAITADGEQLEKLRQAGGSGTHRFGIGIRHEEMVPREWPRCPKGLGSRLGAHDIDVIPNSILIFHERTERGWICFTQNPLAPGIVIDLTTPKPSSWLQARLLCLEVEAQDLPAAQSKHGRDIYRLKGNIGCLNQIFPWQPHKQETSTQG